VGLRVVDAGRLTPFERHGGRWYKRDDLFVPFDDLALSGGKVRQALALLVPAARQIKGKHHGVVLTATGVHSPQGLIIARVCQQLGLRCVLFIGATNLGGALVRHPMLRRAIEVGAEIDCTARVAYESALAAAIERWREAHGGGFVVKFGINLEDDPDAILGSTARQVANLPLGVRRIVVPVGAGVTAAGVIIGAAQLDRDVRVVCVQIAGYDRREAIDRMLHAYGGGAYQWEVVVGVPYSKLVQRWVGSRRSGFGLDPIYESKAHDWLVAHEARDETVAFWVVGDSRAVRSSDRGEPPNVRTAALA
jgi:1-aminocyclopropane-1-carboxylate deaminase/D-cysteine desulfhydrase-like pyridoxal-dependent ACC family enzyme